MIRGDCWNRSFTYRYPRKPQLFYNMAVFASRHVTPSRLHRGLEIPRTRDWKCPQRRGLRTPPSEVRVRWPHCVGPAPAADHKPLCCRRRFRLALIPSGTACQKDGCLSSTFGRTLARSPWPWQAFARPQHVSGNNGGVLCTSEGCAIHAAYTEPPDGDTTNLYVCRLSSSGFAKTYFGAQ